MKNLFDELSHSVSKLTTNKYSTSFSLGILALKPSIRKSIYSIYGYVRLADEIVDSFHDYDKVKLLEMFKSETTSALADKISLNPIINSFQETVHKYNIDRALIEQFLHSMEMDINPMDYDLDRYNEYIYGSAEVVGLMCLQVFTEGFKSEYERLKPYAMKLGSAFQKVNFLRDLKDDYNVLGRVYFPDVNMEVFDNDVKRKIEEDIENEFNDALKGIKMLPPSSKFGVYLAYKYYRSLFNKIKNSTSTEILKQRIRVPNSKKAIVALESYLRYKTALL